MKATGGWARKSAQYPRPNWRRPSGDTSGACQRTARRPAARNDRPGLPNTFDAKKGFLIVLKKNKAE